MAKPLPAKKDQRSQQQNGATIRNTIAMHFLRISRDTSYLTRLANEHPAAYVSLVSKCVPQQAHVEVTHHAVDLGSAMLAAERNLRALNERAEGMLIDVTPDASLDAGEPAPATSDAGEPAPVTSDTGEPGPVTPDASPVPGEPAPVTSDAAPVTSDAARDATDA